MNDTDSKSQLRTIWDERTCAWVNQVAEQQQFQEKIGKHIKMIFTEKKIYELEQEMLHD